MNKCQFFKKEIEFLGFTISENGIGVIKEKVEPIAKVPPPKNIKELRSFLDNVVKPIAFNSRALTKAERNYSQLDREALGIVFAVKTFHQYLYGRKFLLETDHKPLQFIFNPKKGLPVFAASWVQRWAVFLSGYHYDLVHIKGTSNVIADYLSRAPKLSEEEMEKNEFTYLDYVESEIHTIDSELIREETKKDMILSQVLEYVMNGWPDKVDAKIDSFKNRYRELAVERECLMWGYRVVIPSSLREMLLRELHSSHMGIVRMKAVARSYIWWPGIDGDIENTTQRCILCLENSDNPPRAKLQNWKWPEGPNQRLHIDFLGPIDGRMYMVIIDAFSKWLEVKEMKDITSRTTIVALKEYFRSWGYPEIIVSDNGPSLGSEEFEKFMDDRRILHIKTAPYHPASNGAAENAVKTFKNKFKLLLKEGLSREEALDRFLLSYRSTPHCTTGCSPAELQCGRPMRTSIDLVRPNLRGHVLKQQLSQQIHASGNRKCLFSYGDIVMAKDVMRNKWIQAKVMNQLSPVTYVVKTIDDRLWKRHIDQLKSSLLTEKPALVAEVNPGFLDSFVNEANSEDQPRSFGIPEKSPEFNEPQVSENKSRDISDREATVAADESPDSPLKSSELVSPVSDRLTPRPANSRLTNQRFSATPPVVELRRSSRIGKPVERLNL
ncbi:uncharacterized protein K02A2.6-like [Fopius arisanus]|uniref:RNA-directed DNA polymerase n=1 Tax=Fopius arisanus TaxID=64838 RepID=A0A9R1TQ17_9HYME|nr:PREDICTED: uncharacterized protein K02A2.6-like [Fopius arisanus]